MSTPQHSIGDVQPKPSYLPVNSRSAPLGTGAPLCIQSNCRTEELNALMKLARRVLDNPKAMQQLSDRVYELMQEECRYLHDHHPGCRSRLR